MFFNSGHVWELGQFKFKGGMSYEKNLKGGGLNAVEFLVFQWYDQLAKKLKFISYLRRTT